MKALQEKSERRPRQVDGCDLSRDFRAAPLADAPMMVIFLASDKRPFP
jgi:hypothetical protein